MRRPGKRFSVYTHEDGTKWVIRTRETGRGEFEFFCFDEGLNFHASTPKEVRDLLVGYLNEHHGMVWEPVIVTGKASWKHDDLFGMEFNRYFRGMKKDKHIVFRSWDYKDEKGRPNYEEHGTRLDIGSPGTEAHPDRSQAVFPYTTERWTTLLQLEQAIRAIGEKVTDLVNPDDSKYDDRYDKGVPKRLDDAFKAMGGNRLLGLEVRPNPDSDGPKATIDMILPEKPKKEKKA